MQKILFTLLALTALLFSGCGEKKVANPNIQTVTSLTNDITIGKTFQNITLKNQFDKSVSLNNKTKKIVFVFQKASGHTARNFIDSKPGDYLSDKNIAFIADISGMPSIIASMFALPDFRKHKYSVMLIRDEKLSAKYRNDKYADYIAIISLNNFKITGIKLVSTGKQLEETLGK